MDDFGRLMTALGLGWNIHHDAGAVIDVTTFGSPSKSYLKEMDLWSVTVTGTVWGDVSVRATSLEGAQALAIKQILENAGAA